MVEWPDRAPGLAEAADLRLTLEYRDAGRTARLVGVSRRGQAVVENLARLRDTQSED
jgi:tRNA A37 threonylcarbamoyladenosine biosynthesis protein TsaE